MNYFTPEFTQDLSANSPQIYSKTYPQIHTRFIQKLIPKFTQYLFKNLFAIRAKGQRGHKALRFAARPCIALVPEFITHF